MTDQLSVILHSDIKVESYTTSKLNPR